MRDNYNAVQNPLKILVNDRIFDVTGLQPQLCRKVKSIIGDF